MRVARRRGLVAQPSVARWHSRPTALFGGIAIVVSFLASAVLLTDFSSDLIRARVTVLLLGTLIMFITGMVDDLRGLKPATKLIVQVIAACLLVSSGVYFKLFGMPLITIPLTILWVVGITNAFNLLDNMDGLAAGIAAIAAAAIFALNLLLGREPSLAQVTIAFCGALLGFLIYNFYPARIFMGDSGSMAIGFTLSGLAILGSWEQASNVLVVMAVPVLILGVPIFDTTFVALTRRLRGQPVSQGGRDHTSHRLVALGLSERRAVVVLWAICTAFATVAVLSLRFEAFLLATAASLAVIVLLIFGVFLSQDRLYRRLEPERAAADPERPLSGAWETSILSKRRILEVLIDVALIGAAMTSAYLILYQGDLSSQRESDLVTILPLLMLIKLPVFWAFGLYRRLWDFVGVHDLVVVTFAVAASAVLSVAGVWVVTGLESYPLTLFLLDGIVLLLFAAGSRILFRVFEETLTRAEKGSKRLLIVGAGRAGELVLRTLRNQPELGYRAVGFIDDDPGKWGRGIHGIRILGGREQIDRLGSRDAFDEIVVAMPSLAEEDRQSLAALCRATGKTTHVMKHVSTTFLGS